MCSSLDISEAPSYRQRRRGAAAWDRPFRIEWLFTIRCGVLVRLRLRALAFEVRVSEFRVAVTPCILVCPTLVPALSLDLLPDNRVVLCADKGVAPPVGWAKDLQQLALDGIYVLEALFERVLGLMSRAHDEPPPLQRTLLRVRRQAHSVRGLRRSATVCDGSSSIQPRRSVCEPLCGSIPMITPVTPTSQ